MNQERQKSQFRVFLYQHTGVEPVAQVCELRASGWEDAKFISLDQLKSQGWEIINVYPEGGKLWALCRRSGEQDV